MCGENLKGAKGIYGWSFRNLGGQCSRPTVENLGPTPPPAMDLSLQKVLMSHFCASFFLSTKWGEYGKLTSQGVWSLGLK